MSTAKPSSDPPIDITSEHLDWAEEAEKEHALKMSTNEGDQKKKKIVIEHDDASDQSQNGDAEKAGSYDGDHASESGSYDESDDEAKFEKEAKVVEYGKKGKKKAGGGVKQRDGSSRPRLPRAEFEKLIRQFREDLIADLCALSADGFADWINFCSRKGQEKYQMNFSYMMWLAAKHNCLHPDDERNEWELRDFEENTTYNYGDVKFSIFQTINGKTDDHPEGVAFRQEILEHFQNHPIIKNKEGVYMYRTNNEDSRKRWMLIVDPKIALAEPKKAYKQKTESYPALGGASASSGMRRDNIAYAQAAQQQQPQQQQQQPQQQQPQPDDPQLLDVRHLQLQQAAQAQAQPQMAMAPTQGPKIIGTIMIDGVAKQGEVSIDYGEFLKLQTYYNNMFAQQMKIHQQHAMMMQQFVAPMQMAAMQQPILYHSGGAVYAQQPQQMVGQGGPAAS